MDFKKALVTRNNVGVGVNLTNDQMKAYELMKAWYNNDSQLTFTLKGYAGTGKTFLIKYFLDSVVRVSVCVTAPTHKAVKVIEQATNRPGRTLQSLHGLKPNFNLDKFNTDNIRYDTIGTEHIKNYKLVIIDECGQIGSNLFELNTERSQRYKTKILYIGDPAQLPPINERYSKTFNVANTFELKEIVRQEEGNPLLKILGMLRQDIVTQGSTALHYIWNKQIEMNDVGEGFIKVPKVHFDDQLFKAMKSKEFSSNIQYAKYSAWTNNSINTYNKLIRTDILEDTHDVLTNNDLLTGYKTIVDEFNEPILTNSEDYVIMDIHRRMSENGFMTFVATLVGITSKTQCTVNIVDHYDDSYEQFYMQVSKLQRIAVNSDSMSKGKNWRKYFEFKNKYMTIVDIPVPINEVRTDMIPKELDYGYGLTVHKLQGSTINNMFINVLDITCYNGNPKTPIRNSKSSPYAIELRNKLLYTAISRAKDKVYLQF